LAYRFLRRDNRRTTVTTLSQLFLLVGAVPLAFRVCGAL
jgi:hypothetical protein